jgi:hypothetical protein
MPFIPKGPAIPPIPRQPAQGIPITPLAKRHTLILTGAVALITVVGTLISATLKPKEQAETKQECIPEP